MLTYHPTSQKIPANEHRTLVHHMVKFLLMVIHIEKVLGEYMSPISGKFEPPLSEIGLHTRLEKVGKLSFVFLDYGAHQWHHDFEVNLIPNLLRPFMLRGGRNLQKWAP